MVDSGAEKDSAPVLFSARNSGQEEMGFKLLLPLPKGRFAFLPERVAAIFSSAQTQGSLLSKRLKVKPAL
jgi:hypothetical protein